MRRLIQIVFGCTHDHRRKQIVTRRGVETLVLVCEACGDESVALALDGDDRERRARLAAARLDALDAVRESRRATLAADAAMRDVSERARQPEPVNRDAVHAMRDVPTEATRER